MCAAVPRGVSPEHAAFSTVGAIAMHGVRRAETQLGDTACVIGLGLIGQLVVRLLVASGVRVVGLDVIEEQGLQALRYAFAADSSYASSYYTEFLYHWTRCEFPEAAELDRCQDQPVRRSSENPASSRGI